MRLGNQVQVQPIRVFLSSSMKPNDHDALRLREVIRALGERYELINIDVFEGTAAVATLVDYQEQMIRDCDVVAIILLRDVPSEDPREIDVPLGVTLEMSIARRYRKPVLVFHDKDFVTHNPERREARERILDDLRAFPQSITSSFDSVHNLIGLFENSIVNMLIRHTRDGLARFSERAYEPDVVDVRDEVQPIGGSKVEP